MLKFLREELNLTKAFCFLFFFNSSLVGQEVSVAELLKFLHQSQEIQMRKDQVTNLRKTVVDDRPREPWEITWSRENQHGSETEEFLSIQRTFPTPALRKAHQQLARIESEQIDLDFSRYMKSLELELLEKFYDGLRLQKEIEIRSNYLGEFDRLVQKLAFRVQEGIGPAYDLRRLRQQQILEKEIIQSLKTDYRSVLKSLEILCLDTVSITALQGDLLPQWNDASLERALLTLESNQDLEFDRLELNRLIQKQAELKKRFISNFSLEIGAKRIKNGSQSSKGNIVGLSAPLSIGDPFAVRRVRLSTQARLTKMEYERKRVSLIKKLDNLSYVIVQRISQSNGMRKSLIEPASQLSQVKVQAYRNGGGSLADLLDSRRHLLESYLQTHEISFAARKAWLKFGRLLTGVD